MLTQDASLDSIPAPTWHPEFQGIAPQLACPALGVKPQNLGYTGLFLVFPYRIVLYITSLSFTSEPPSILH